MKPVTCSRCGEKTCFVRRIFEITGVAKNKQADEQTQQLIRFHFKQRYSIDFIFFKTHEGRFFVDSAVCGGCKSTAITYDIELFDQDLISEVSKLTGRSEVQVKKDLTKLANSQLKKNYLKKFNLLQAAWCFSKYSPKLVDTRKIRKEIKLNSFYKAKMAVL